jgi:iron complex outermembrane receptor protein/vitamin B12 transporter
MKTFRLFRTGLLTILLSHLSISSLATGTAGVRGSITDPLGAVIPNARVELLQQSNIAASATTDAQGKYEFTSISAGHYRVRAQAPGFAVQESAPFYVGGNSLAEMNLVLSIGAIAQQVVVSATGTELPESQVGASVSVITSNQFQNKLDLFDPLRQLPGVQILQSGERGGNASMFIRGGDSNANKVLLDGIPLNDIGGTVNFGDIATTGVQRAEVMRGPNSVVYGSDALAGVVNLTTRRGVTPLPDLEYSFDAGNFNSLRHDVSLGGAFRQLDYFSEFSRFDTGNSIPNNSFHNGTYAGNFGWTPNSATDVRLTGRYISAVTGLPNAIEIYGIPDDSFQRDQDAYLGVTAQNQTTARWHNLLRYGATRLREQFETPAPQGIPLFGNFVGDFLTITGANGFSTTGQAILDFGGTYPVQASSSSKRDFVYFQSDYNVSPHLLALFGFRYENERGYTLSSLGKTPTDRNNFSYTAEFQGNVWNRVYATAGIGVEKNAVFGVAATPKVSLVYYLLRPRAEGSFNGTRLQFNYGQGIKEPSIFEQTSSLFDLLSQLPNGSQLISQFHIPAIAPERSRSYDFGLEQSAWNGRARLGATFFYNRFTNQIEFVSNTALPLLGVPAPIAAQTGFGATINSADTRALGAETELQISLGHGLTARAAYTYLDAVLLRSFSSDALCVTVSPPPCINPEIPNVLIGAFGPLVGDRPFRRAPHTGSFFLLYAKSKYSLSLSGYLTSRRNDSTFATDAFFGNTMLLPNRDLASSFQKIDLAGSYRLNSHLTFFTSIENLANDHYDEFFGFPALPLTFRSGIKIHLGGESWK